MTGIVEKVARALSIADGMHPDAASNDEDEMPAWTLYVVSARAAINAMRTPTDAMIKAEAEYDHYEGNRGRLTHEAEEAWGVMIDAALNEGP